MPQLAACDAATTLDNQHRINTAPSKSALAHEADRSSSKHAVKPDVGARSISLGGTPTESYQEHCQDIQHRQDLAMSSGTVSETVSRTVSGTSSTMTGQSQPQCSPSNTITSSSSLRSTSPKPPRVVRRNTSGSTANRASSHAALKKNFSNGHLHRHGTNKTSTKLIKPSAPTIKRSQSLKSVSSLKSQKSQKSVIAAQQPQPQPQPPPQPQQPYKQPAVRFNIEANHSLGGEETDDNEWTDSTSLSPATTRDHTRQNSVILNHPLHTLHIPPSSHSTKPPSARSESSQRHGKPEQEAVEANELRRHNLTHSIPTADAITSRLLMRTPAINSPTLSNVSATAIGTPSHSHTSQSPNSTPLEGATSSGSGGRNLVSRFLAGGNSQGATCTNLTLAMDGDETPGQSIVQHTSEGESEANNSNSTRRNKSTTNITSTKSGRSTPLGSIYLPPSRTSQKLELQRASTMVEPARKVPAVPMRSSAPLLFNSGINTIALNCSSTGLLPAQIQGLFAQVDKEYTVIRRFRRPVQDALYRLERRNGSIDAIVGLKNSASLSRTTEAASKSQTNISKMPVADLRYVKSHSQINTNLPAERPAPRPRLPSHRHSRVAFELPDSPGVQSPGGLGEMGLRGNDGQVDDITRICRQMWELSSIPQVQS